MREIKFRGKRIDNGEWVYGYFVKANENKHYIVQMNCFAQLVNCDEVDPATVGQLVGIFNGQKIYEGCRVLKDGAEYEVRWDGKGFSLASKTNGWPKREDGYNYYETNWNDIELLKEQ